MDPKLIARKTRDLFGGEPKIRQHYNDDESIELHILRSADRPQVGVSSYATVDLSTFDNQLFAADGRPIRVELLAACQAEFAAMEDVLASCALNVATGEYSVTPDIIMPDVVRIHEPRVRAKHALLTTPFLWGEEPRAVEEEEFVTTWLQLVPVTQSEFDFAMENGNEALIGTFDRLQIDIFDINRPAVV